MVACRAIIKSSFDNLPANPPLLRDAFLLIAGLWPSTDSFRDKDRVLMNLAAAVYGALKPVQSRQILAKTALEKLIDRSLIGLEQGEDGARIQVHDLLVDVANLLVKEGESVNERRFFTWEEDLDLESFINPNWQHIVVLSGQLPISRFLSSSESSILSLVVARPSHISDWVAVIQKASRCRLLDVDGAVCSFPSPTLRLQGFQNLQCLRLQFCNIQELPEGIEGLKHLSVLVILKSNKSCDNGECYIAPHVTCIQQTCEQRRLVKQDIMRFLHGSVLVNTRLRSLRLIISPIKVGVQLLCSISFLWKPM